MLLEAVNLTKHTHALALPAPRPQVLSLRCFGESTSGPTVTLRLCVGRHAASLSMAPAPRHLHPRGSFAVAWQMWVISSAKVDNSNINQAKQNQTKARVPAFSSILLFRTHLRLLGVGHNDKNHPHSSSESVSMCYTELRQLQRSRLPLWANGGSVLSAARRGRCSCTPLPLSARTGPGELGRTEGTGSPRSARKAAAK